MSQKTENKQRAVFKVRIEDLWGSHWFDAIKAETSPIPTLPGFNCLQVVGENGKVIYKRDLRDIAAFLITPKDGK